MSGDPGLRVFLVLLVRLSFRVHDVSIFSGRTSMGLYAWLPVLAIFAPATRGYYYVCFSVTSR